jgi:hypothetical protein
MFRGRQMCQRVSETYRSPYEITSSVDTGGVCGGHRGSGAMADDAEVVGGGCGFGTFDWDGVRGEVLWPAHVSEVDKAANDNSLVMRI